MKALLDQPWLVDILVNLVVSGIVFAIGYAVGKYRQRLAMRGRNLEQYDFYPFVVDAHGFPEFSGMWREELLALGDAGVGTLNAAFGLGGVLGIVAGLLLGRSSPGAFAARGPGR